MFILKTQKIGYNYEIQKPCCETMQQAIEVGVVVAINGEALYVECGLTLQFCPFCGEKITVQDLNPSNKDCK